MSVSSIPQTPAGARLKGWWDAKKFVGGPKLDFDEMVRVVLNVQPPEESTTLAALMEALKSELSMFTASDEQWAKVAGSLEAKLAGLGIILVASDPNQGGEL